MFNSTSEIQKPRPWIYNLHEYHLSLISKLVAQVESRGTVPSKKLLSDFLPVSRTDCAISNLARNLMTNGIITIFYVLIHRQVKRGKGYFWSWIEIK
jgi:hypothetical protein